MNKIILSFLVMFLLGGCNSNPYPDGNISNRPEVERQEVKPSMGIDVPNIITFDEGVETKQLIRVSVPQGRPILQWIGLPQGATYDPTTSILSWAPGFTAANDPNDYTVKVKDYLVTLKLRSDTDPISEIFRTITLKVKDTPRPLKLVLSDSSVNLNEGIEKEITKIFFESEDYPNGPFQISLKNGQIGVLRRGQNVGEWTLSTKALGYGTVKSVRDCTRSYCSVYMEELISVFSPDGRKQVKTLKIYLKDKRMPVSITLPSKIDSRGDFSMGFSAFDQNEEVTPTVMISKAPALGKFEIKASESKKTLNYEAKYFISWTDLPQEAYGKSFDFTLRACNSTLSYALNNKSCQDFNYEINVTEREIILPEISRNNWATGQVKFLVPGKEFGHRLPISAGGGARIHRIHASSTDSEDTVTYSGDFIKIVPKVPGLKAAQLQVTNTYGGSALESFFYEVLPQNWASNLVIGLGGESTELTSLENQLGSFNRAFYGRDGWGERSLAMRNRVIAGTHSLRLPGGSDELAFFGSNLKDILISTPNLKALPASIVDELRSQGVYLAGRASDLGGFDLKEFEFVPARDLGLPTGATSLSGTTTSESFNPALLSVTMSSYCTRLYSLFKPGPTPSELLIGVSCTRENGGRLVVLGFEWADIRVSENDLNLPAQWFKRMME